MFPWIVDTFLMIFDQCLISHMTSSSLERGETWFRFLLHVLVDDLDCHLVIKSECWYVFVRRGLFLLWGPEQLKGVPILGYRIVLSWRPQTSLAPLLSMDSGWRARE